MTIFDMMCYLSVVKHLNFSAAAKEVFISQPAMSAKIGAIENELGVKLFYRDSHKVELTPAGAVVHEEFQAMIGQYDRLVNNIRNNRISGDNHLSVCFNGPSDWAGVNELIHRFHIMHPDIDIDLRLGCWGEHVTELIRGNLDLVFTEQAEIANVEGVNSIFLFRDFTAFAVPTVSGLAQREPLKLESVTSGKTGKRYDIVIENEKKSTKSMRQIYRRLGEAGLNMENPRFVDSFEVAIAMVSSNLAIAPIPRSFKVNDNSAVSYVDIDSEKVYLDFYLAWLAKNEKPAIAMFSEFCARHSW